MARCARCNKFMLLNTSTGYCKDCDVAIAAEREKARQEEERRRKEEEERRRKAEEERKRKEEEEKRRIEERKQQAAKQFSEAKANIDAGDFNYAITRLKSVASYYSDCIPQEQVTPLIQEAESKLTEKKYQEAVTKLAEAEELWQIEAARSAFASLGSYKDSETKIQECLQKKANIEAEIEEKRRLEEEARRQEELKKKEEEERRKAEERERIRREQEERKRLRIEKGYVCEDFPLRCGVLFGDTVEDVLEKETQKPYLDSFKAYASKTFITDTENTFKKLEKLRPDYSKYKEVDALKEQYTKKYLLPGGMVYRYRSEYWKDSYKDYSKGDFIVTANGMGPVPNEKDSEKWFCGTVAELQNCLIHYSFDDEAGLTTMDYMFVREGESELTPYGFEKSSGERAEESAREKLKAFLLNKYGDPIFSMILVDFEVKKMSPEKRLYYDLYRQIALQRISNGRMQKYPHLQMMWRVPCSDGNVLICLSSAGYEWSLDCSLNTCGSKNSYIGPKLQENICAVVYHYMPKNTLNEKLERLNNANIAAAAAARRKEEERIDKINSEI